MLDQPNAISQRRKVLALWFIAIAVAFVFDGTVSRLFEAIAVRVKHSEFAEEIKEPGHFVFLLILALFVWILHPSRWRGAIMLLLTGMLAGLFYSLAKWPVGRTRPVKGIEPYHFEPFNNGLHGFLHSDTNSFPSGHACLAFATAACMAYLLPRGRWAFYLVAGLLALERVAEQAHYPSDVVAAAGLGILAFHCVKALMSRLISEEPAAASLADSALAR